MQSAKGHLEPLSSLNTSHDFDKQTDGHHINYEDKDNI